MQVRVSVEDDFNIIGGLRKLNKTEAGQIQNYVVAEISKDYAEYQRERYLSGQYLSVRSGVTKDSVRFYKVKDGRFEVSPGVGIVGRKNYLGIYETGGEIKPRNKKVLAFDVGGQTVFARSVYIDKLPFVTDSKKSYEQSQKPLIIMRNIWTGVFKKKGLV